LAVSSCSNTIISAVLHSDNDDDDGGGGGDSWKLTDQVDIITTLPEIQTVILSCVQSV